MSLSVSSTTGWFDLVTMVTQLLAEEDEAKQLVAAAQRRRELPLTSRLAPSRSRWPQRGFTSGVK